MRNIRKKLLCTVIAAFQLAAVFNLGTVSAETIDPVGAVGVISENAEIPDSAPVPVREEDYVEPDAEADELQPNSPQKNAAAAAAETTVAVKATNPAKSTTAATTAKAAKTTTAAKTTKPVKSTTTVKTTTAAKSTTTAKTTAAKPETAVITTTAAAPSTTVPATTEAAPEKGWNKDLQGRFFFVLEDGSYAKGVHEIDGQKYLFAENGVLKTSWRTVDGKRLYFDPETGQAVYGLIRYNGTLYYVAKDGKTSGYVYDETDGSAYIFDENGAVVKDKNFIEIDNVFYCAGEDGKLLTGKQTIDGIPYLFGNNGRLKTGWRTIDGKRYCYNSETGECRLGLFEYLGKLYYVTVENGKLTGEAKIGNVWYKFDSYHGDMMLGWQTVQGAKHYYYNDGTAALGFTEIENAKYYFDESGAALTGDQVINGEKYIFDSDGRLFTGWKTIDGKKYYYNTNGQLSRGFVTVDGKIFHFDESGAYTEGWQAINGELYYFNADKGAMTGFREFTTGFYLFDNTGKRLTGWQTVDGVLRYFNTDTGLMAVSCVIDNYEINADGAAIKLSEAQIKANGILASIGRTPSSIYSYVRSNNKYKLVESTKSLAAIEKLGWSHFALYAMNNRYIVCYYFAAVTDVLFKQAGYETRVVYGTGRGTGDHYWNQIKIDGVWVNYDTCNGYANVTDDYLKSQKYTWKQYVYPQYN